MEDKIELNIAGLSYSHTQSGAYALILSDKGGKRRLPIIIGSFEAQAIAVVLENMKPGRPLTHDAFASVMKEFEVRLIEVVIYNLVEGVFYAKLICDNGFKEVEIDARTSDAIALALRFGAPIFTHEFILSQAGVSVEEDQEDSSEEEESVDAADEKPEGLGALSAEDLEEKLNAAIQDEDYELASKIRDEINRRK